MLIERTEGEYLNNAYLVADRPEGDGVLVDPNGDVEPLLARAAAQNITISYVIATHEHFDHVVDIEPLATRLGAAIVAPAAVAGLVPGTTRSLQDGQHLRVGDLDLEVIDVPGHSPGQMALLVNDSHCLTADALFADSVGAQWEVGQPAFDEVRSSVMERLLSLPRDTILLPGHSRDTTVGHEWDHNPFVQVWRGLVTEGDEPCLVGQPFGWEARLIFRGPDYDGGTKAWVRFARGGDLLVAGSQVRPAPYPMAVSIVSGS